MSRYTIGIDVRVKDETYYCITKQPSELMKLINRILKRGDTWKIIYCGADPNQIRKYRYKWARILEERNSSPKAQSKSNNKEGIDG